MKKKFITILLFVLSSNCLAFGADPIDFYTNASIVNGDAFGNVRTFNNITVDMTGGEILGVLQILDTSTFNANGGSITSDVSVSSVLNFYYLQNEPQRIWTQGSAAVINVYGKNFQYEQYSSDWWLHGNWANGEDFILKFRGPDTHNSVILHEIPEPCTLALFLAGFYAIIRKPVNKIYS